MNAILVFGVLLVSFISVRAQEIPIHDGHNPHTRLSLAQVAQEVQPGTIIVMGENHGLRTAQQAQLELMNALRNHGLSVSVGMEFFYYVDQPLVDGFRSGSLSEESFLEVIKWGQPSFDFYRDQVLFPRYGLGERTLALNAPRTITGKVSKVGIDGLTDIEKQMLPPGFQLGRASYKERFLAQMKPHLPSAEAGERYFQAQSIWDDTMAWRAADFIEAHPEQVLVIVVGDFHAAYGGGLPDRIEARTGRKPLVFSYLNIQGLSSQEIEQEVDPRTVYGPRAHYLWFAQE